MSFLKKNLFRIAIVFALSSDSEMWINSAKYEDLSALSFIMGSIALAVVTTFFTAVSFASAKITPIDDGEARIVNGANAEPGQFPQSSVFSIV